MQLSALTAEDLSPAPNTHIPPPPPWLTVNAQIHNQSKTQRGSDCGKHSTLSRTFAPQVPTHKGKGLVPRCWGGEGLRDLLWGRLLRNCLLCITWLIHQELLLEAVVSCTRPHRIKSFNIPVMREGVSQVYQHSSGEGGGCLTRHTYR